MKRLLCLLCALPLAVQAATLTNVPMQGMMVMPMISYDAGTDTLGVMVDPTVPQLTPLLVSNPADSFDPADPWFQNLDPSREGRSFSRRYGFVMDAMSDVLPANRAIWLRKLSGAADLGFYRYRNTAPKEWTPIFGTDGSSNALAWNLMMFHPGVSATPGTNALTATFEAFLVDPTDGDSEVPGGSTGPFAFNYTNVSDGRPSVTIGWKPAVSWPANSTNWVLEYASSMTATNWTAVTNAPTTFDGSPAVLVETGTNVYYRMRRSP